MSNKPHSLPGTSYTGLEDMETYCFIDLGEEVQGLRSLQRGEQLGRGALVHTLRERGVHGEQRKGARMRHLPKVEVLAFAVRFHVVAGLHLMQKGS